MANAKPTFSFGQPASSAQKSTSLFGSAPATQPSSLFGGGGNTSTGSGSSLFGSTGAAKPATPLFGGQASSNAAPNTSSASLFSNTSTAGGFKFASTTTSNPSPSIFGSAAASSSSSPAPSIFAAKPATDSQQKTTFGSAQPDMSSKDPKSVLFPGAEKPAVTSGGLFQNLAAPGSNTPQAKGPSNLTFTPMGQPPSSGVSSSSLFGAKAGESKSGNNSGKSLFGELKQNDKGTENAPSPFNKPATSASAAPSLFSSASTPQQASSLFAAAKPADNSTTPAQPQSSGLFSNLGKKDDKPAESSAPSTSSLFASTPKSSAPGAASLFSNPTQSSTASSGQAASSLFATASKPAASTSAGSGLFGTAPAASQPAPTPASTSTSASGLFGSATTTSQPTATSTTSAPSLGGLFGAAKSTQADTSATPAAANATSNATSNPPATTGNFQASTTTLPPGSRLASKSLDEVITTWSTSLATHQKSFADVSERVAKWDRQLVQNSSAIGNLYSRVFQAERDQAEVERQLSLVESNQRELEARLDKYESEIDGMLEQAGLGEDGVSSGVDGEREQTYRAAEDCQARLTEMGHDLSSMIDEINNASNKISSTKKADGEDPLAQIVRTLNSHLAQLQVIDKGSASLTLKVEAAQKEAGILASRNGASGGREWVEGFGRSYLGRR